MGRRKSTIEEGVLNPKKCRPGEGRTNGALESRTECKVDGLNGKRGKDCEGD